MSTRIHSHSRLYDIDVVATEMKHSESLKENDAMEQHRVVEFRGGGGNIAGDSQVVVATLNSVPSPQNVDSEPPDGGLRAWLVVFGVRQSFPHFIRCLSGDIRQCAAHLQRRFLRCSTGHEHMNLMTLLTR